jgi:hypothetical protein
MLIPKPEVAPMAQLTKNLSDAMRRAVPVPMAQKSEIASARVSKSDRKFFERRSHRKLRLRRAFKEEIALNPEPPPYGFRWFAVVHHASPGVRIRQFIAASSKIDADMLNEQQIQQLVLNKFVSW